MPGLTTITLKVPRYKVFNETANNGNKVLNLPFFRTQNRMRVTVVNGITVGNYTFWVGLVHSSFVENIEQQSNLIQ